MCRGSGVLPSQVFIALRSGQRTEAFEQYHEDTHIFQEFAIAVSSRGVEASPVGLRELAKLIQEDYDLDTGFETVTRTLKTEMLNVATRITRVVGIAAA